MKLAHCNAMSVGIFSWVSLEPSEGKFEFGWLDEIMDRLVKNGKLAEKSAVGFMDSFGRHLYISGTENRPLSHFRDGEPSPVPVLGREPVYAVNGPVLREFEMKAEKAP